MAKIRGHLIYDNDVVIAIRTVFDSRLIESGNKDYTLRS